MEYVTKDMIMGDIIGKYPVAVPILLNYGLHCVGCHVNAFETLEQGSLGHGMDAEEIKEMLDEVNTAIDAEAKEIKSGAPIIVTKKAAIKIKEFSEELQKKNAALRITIMPGGCSGQSYAMDFDENITEADELIEENGVKIVVSKEDMEFLKGSKIDYLETLQASGFRVDNPNAHNKCGCGQSFS